MAPDPGSLHAVKTRGAVICAQHVLSDVVSDRSVRDRGISPVVGITLLTAIVVALSVVTGGIFFSLGQEKDPAPGVSMSLEAEGVGAVHLLIHENGDVLDGDQVKIRGLADSEALAGEEVAAGDRHRVAPTDDTVELVWYGEQGTSYVIWEGSVPEQDTISEPDKGCPWVDSESNGGVDDVKVDGIVVDCDVETEKVIEVQNGGIVIGDTSSELKEVDADEAQFYGDVTVENNLNLQDGIVTGAVTSNDLVKIDNGTVGGSIKAANTIEVVDGSSVGDDVTSDSDLVKVLSSDISGSVATDASGSIKLQDATVSGEVYVDDDDLDCTDSTIAGQDCSEYTPKDPNED